jgi:hypothetical protein
MHSRILDLAQHATAAALLVLSCQTHSSHSQKLIHVRSALLVNMEMQRTMTRVVLTIALLENLAPLEVLTSQLVKPVRKESSAMPVHGASTKTTVHKECTKV